jgi:hypothetical protein
MLTMEVKQTSDKTVTAKDSWKDFMEGLASSIYVIKNVAAALKDMYGAMADTNKQTFAQSNAAAGMGLSDKELQGALQGGSIIGISPDNMQKGLQAFKAEMSDIRATGTLNTTQGQTMGQLGLDISKESQKKPETAVADLVDAALARALKDGDPGKARVLLTKAAGGAAAVADAMFDALRNKNVQKQGYHTAEDLFNRGNSMNFLSGGGIAGATDFTLENNILLANLASIMSELCGDVGGVLAPYIKDLNTWLETNKPQIQDAIESLTNVIKIAFKVTEETIAAAEKPAKLQAEADEKAKKQVDLLHLIEQLQGVNITDPKQKEAWGKSMQEVYKTQTFAPGTGWDSQYPINYKTLDPKLALGYLEAYMNAYGEKTMPPEKELKYDPTGGGRILEIAEAIKKYGAGGFTIQIDNKSDATVKVIKDIGTYLGGSR